MKMPEGPGSICEAGLSGRRRGTSGVGGARASECSGCLDTGVVVGTIGSCLRLALPSSRGSMGTGSARSVRDISPDPARLGEEMLHLGAVRSRDLLLCL